MESIRCLYQYGPGPSSSHTIGPYKAALDFIKDKPSFDKVEVQLYGSLAFTGKGHLTDEIISKGLSPYKAEVIFNYILDDIPHPNTMVFRGYKNGKITAETTYFSVGGGKIVKNNLANIDEIIETYPINKFDEIKEFLLAHHSDDLNIFVNEFEDDKIDQFVEEMANHMLESTHEGLITDGRLPGNIRLHRIARRLYEEAKSSNVEEQLSLYLSAYAYATSEHNANGGMVVTAPTCGSCGVIASIVYYLINNMHLPMDIVVKGLKVASIFGNLAKQNATISGAQGGCQAEIGVASAMGAALLCYVNGLSTHQIEYAAEVALEHFLGLTCDPVEGYVQIPCIERNAIAALRAYNSYLFAKNIEPLRHNRVSYDCIIDTMRETGEDIKSQYKETAEGGLAKKVILRKRTQN